MANGSRIPHSLRIVILLLRLAVGLDFFYLGFTALFAPSSAPALYPWLAASPFKVYFAWIFLVVGACLVLGLLARFAAVVGIAATLVGYWPTLASIPLGIERFATIEPLVAIALLVLIFSDAGTYLGLDKFLHIHFSSAHKA